MDSIDVERFICAFDEPYVGASTNLNGDIVRIKSVCLSQQDGFFHHFQSGLIYRKTKKANQGNFFSALQKSVGSATDMS